MRILFAHIFFTFCATAVSQQSHEQPIKTTVCDIRKHPLSFNRKMVEIYGQATRGFEDSMFEDQSCFPGKSIRLPRIWMDYGGTAAPETTDCCGGAPGKDKSQFVVQGITLPLVRDPSFERFDSLLHAGSETNSRSGVSIRATVRGRIFVEKFKAGQIKYVGGYGHEGCCILLVIEQVLSVASTKPEPRIWEPIRPLTKNK